MIDSGVDGKHPDLKGVLSGGNGRVRRRGRRRPEEHRRQTRARHPGGDHACRPRPPAQEVHGQPQPVGLHRRRPRTGSWAWPPRPRSSPSPPGWDRPTPGGKSDQDQIPEAVRWAVDNGAQVINISLGSTSPEWPQSWDAAFLYAEQKDVVIVCAAGNRVGGNIQVGAPATIPGVLTVAGLNRKGVASIDSSSQGISIGVAAPAENLVGRHARRRLRRVGRHLGRDPHRRRRRCDGRRRRARGRRRRAARGGRARAGGAGDDKSNDGERAAAVTETTTRRRRRGAPRGRRRRRPNGGGARARGRKPPPPPPPWMKRAREL